MLCPLVGKIAKELIGDPWPARQKGFSNTKNLQYVKEREMTNLLQKNKNLR